MFCGNFGDTVSHLTRCLLHQGYLRKRMEMSQSALCRWTLFVFERNNIDENKAKRKLKKPVREKWWFHLPPTLISPSEVFPAVVSGPQCCFPSSTRFLLRYHSHVHHDLHYLLCGVELGEDPVHLPLHCAAPLHAKAGRQLPEINSSEIGKFSEFTHNQQHL